MDNNVHVHNHSFSLYPRTQQHAPTKQNKDASRFNTMSALKYTRDIIMPARGRLLGRGAENTEL